MRKLIGVGVVAVVLVVHTVITDRETKDAEASRGSKIVELEGGDLNYKEEGERDDPTIVLLHGYACSLRWWDRVAPELARRGLHVIRFDLLGHGGSEMPRDGYAPRRTGAAGGRGAEETQGEARDLRRPLDGRQRRERTRRAETAARPPGGRDRDSADAMASSIRRFCAASRRWPVIGELSDRFAPDAAIKAGLDDAFADDVDVPDAFVDDLDGMTFSAFDKSSAESHDFLEDRPNSDRIEDARVPLLVIFGTEDEIVEPEAADRWAKDVPRARVVKMRGVGHSPHWERSRQVAELLLDYTR